MPVAASAVNAFVVVAAAGVVLGVAVGNGIVVGKPVTVVESVLGRMLKETSDPMLRVREARLP